MNRTLKSRTFVLLISLLLSNISDAVTTNKEFDSQVLLLDAKDNISRDTFFSYWRDVHGPCDDAFSELGAAHGPPSYFVAPLWSSRLLSGAGFC